MTILEYLDKVNNYLNDVYDYKEIKEEVRKDINTIKQALLKAQEQEKENAKYKQLEKQMGCSLNIILKLIDQNELYYQFFDEFQHWNSIKVDLRKKVVWFCKQVGGHYACSQPLSNYGKTFWLRKDKSE